MSLGYDNVRFAGWLHVHSEKTFDILHRNCDGQMWAHGQYDTPGAACDKCDASYVEGTWFNPEVNPEYDESGHRTGSGEWETVEFHGWIPIYAVKEVE